MRFSLLGPALLLPLTAMACGGSIETSPTTDAGVDVTPVDVAVPPDSASNLTPVNGVVVDEASMPVANASVRLAGVEAKTDSSGKFTILAPPKYDVSVARSGSGTTSTAGMLITQFVGLGTRTPRLQVMEAVARKSSVTLGVSGTGFPLPAGDRAIFVGTPTTALGRIPVAALSEQATKVVDLSWGGEAPTKGTLRGFLVTQAGGYPTAWKDQTAPLPYSIAEGTGKLDVAFGGGAPAVGDLDLTIDASNHTISSLLVSYEPAPGARYPFGILQSFTQAKAKFPFPTAGNVVVRVGAKTALGHEAFVNQAGVKVPANVPIKLPPGDITIAAPGNNASGVGPGSTFSWSTPAGYAYLAFVGCDGSTYRAAILGVAPTFTLPDFAALGASIPPGTSCNWSVTAFSASSDPDALVGATGWVDRLNPYRTAGDVSGFTSATRFFTAK